MDQNFPVSLKDILGPGRAASAPIVKKILVRTGLKDKAILCGFYVALPNALITLCVGLLAAEGYLPWLHSKSPEDTRLVNVETAAWTGIVAGLSFLVVFRATQAYTRFWQAITSVHLLQIEWYDACSSLMAFTSTSQVPQRQIKYFKHLMVRLFSLYHSAALLRLVEPGIDDQSILQIKALDPESLNVETTEAIQNSQNRVELILQWIQVAIMHGMKDQVVVAPPPIVSRCFQEIANGNVKFQDALKVKSIPFPRTYQLACNLLLLMHWIGTPYFTCLWVNSPTVAALLAFCAVFVIQSLIFVARSIENPFSTRQFIREAVDMQDEMNTRLLTLLTPIAQELPTMPNITDEELMSGCIEEVTLGEYWGQNGVRATTSELVYSATTPSRVNFGSNMGAMNTLVGCSGDEEDGRSSRRMSMLTEDGRSSRRTSLSLYDRDDDIKERRSPSGASTLEPCANNSSLSARDATMLDRIDESAAPVRLCPIATTPKTSVSPPEGGLGDLGGRDLAAAFCGGKDLAGSSPGIKSTERASSHDLQTEANSSKIPPPTAVPSSDRSTSRHCEL